MAVASARLLLPATVVSEHKDVREQGTTYMCAACMQGQPRNGKRFGAVGVGGEGGGGRGCTLVRQGHLEVCRRTDPTCVAAVFVMLRNACRYTGDLAIAEAPIQKPTDRFCFVAEHGWFRVCLDSEESHRHTGRLPLAYSRM